MRRLSDLAQATRRAAMQPTAQTERQALAQAIARVAQCGAEDGHIAITLGTRSQRCTVVAHNNAVWLYPPHDTIGEYTSVLSIGRLHGHPLGKTWFGTESATDTQGREWERRFDAVVDDFGTLIEVAA